MPKICIYLLGLCEKKWDKNYSQIMSTLSPLRVKVGGGSCPPRSYGGAAHACSCIGTTLFRWMRTIAWPPYIYRPIYTAMEAADCLITETIHSRSAVPPRPEQKPTIYTWSHRNNSRNCRADGRNNTRMFTGFDSFYQKRNCVNNSIYLSSFPCY